MTGGETAGMTEGETVGMTGGAGMTMLQEWMGQFLTFETPGDGRSQVGAVFQGRDVPPDP